MKRALFFVAVLVLAGCSSITAQKLFIICTVGAERQCFDVDRVKVDERGCVVSEDSVICGHYTIHQNYFLPASPQQQAPAADAPVPPVTARP